MASQGLPVSEDVIRRMVQEVVQPVDERLLNAGSRNVLPKERSLQLKFLDDKVADTETGEEIKGIQDECLKLALLDSNEHTVTCGPGSSAKVEILLLDDNGNGDENNLTLENFERSIIQTGEKKKPHFPKSVYILLKNGVAYLNGLKLGHDRDWIKRCSCRLGARIVQNLEGATVQEAWTAAFKVRDKRDKRKDKLHCPCLTSEVWRLKGIDRTGERCGRLKKENIKTVQDFLFWFHVNPEELQNKILRVSDGTWKKIVRNAESCKIDCEKMFCHKSSSEPQRCVVYDCVGKLKGEIVESEFVGIDNLCDDKKDEVLKLLRSVLGRPSSAFVELYEEFPYTSTSTSTSTNPMAMGDHEPLVSKEIGEESNSDPQFTPLGNSDYKVDDVELGLMGDGQFSRMCGNVIVMQEQWTAAGSEMDETDEQWDYYKDANYGGSPNPMLDYCDADILSGAAAAAAASASEVVNPPRRWKRFYWIWFPLSEWISYAARSCKKRKRD